MAREIKFRAWDKKAKQWLLGYELPNLGGFSLFGEVMMMGEWAALLSSRFPNDQKEIAVMQFTGLLDKNGREIYEGDVVQFQREIKSEGKKKTEVLKLTEQIEWDDVEASFGGGGFTMYQMNEPEIIGNVFENPNLLEA